MPNLTTLFFFRQHKIIETNLFFFGSIELLGGEFLSSSLVRDHPLLNLLSSSTQT